MNKINYSKELDKLIEANVKEEKVPSLLLHSCCAPCSSYVLKFLSDFFRITLLYYNPNIFPEEEYVKRVREQERLINELPVKNPVTFIEGRYEPKEFFDRVRGLENEPEGGARCRKCFEFNLRRTAEMAAESGRAFATTLTVSPRKSSKVLFEIGSQWEDFEKIDFKKKDGYLTGVRFAAEQGYYRQNYCGCEFSRRQAENFRQNKKSES